MMDKKNQLSIVIPTYNRKDRLIRQLRSIYNQRESSLVDIVICDNHSDYDVEAAIRSEFGETLTKNLHVHVNETNVGMHANLALMFRNCQTEWMWSVSDDDETLPYSIASILQDIENEGINTIMLKYGIEGYKKYPEQTINSLPDLVDFYYNNYPAGHLVFLSNNVYNMSFVRKYYSNTISYCYCAIAQLLPSFFALDDGAGVIKFKQRNVIHYLPPALGAGWNFINTALSFSTIVSFPFRLSADYYHRMGAMLLSGFSHKRIVYYCLSYEDRKRGRDIYKHLYKEAFRYSGSLKDRILNVVFDLCYLLHIVVPDSWNE